MCTAAGSSIAGNFDANYRTISQIWKRRTWARRSGLGAISLKYAHVTFTGEA